MSRHRVSRSLLWRAGLATLVVGCLGVGLPAAMGQEPARMRPDPSPPPSPHTVFSIVRNDHSALSSPARWHAVQGSEHPLQPALRWARRSLSTVERLADYSATLVMRERVDGVLGDPEYLSLKIRHRPFSVYASFLKSTKTRVRDVLYVEGQNDNRMWILRGPLLNTLSLKPDSTMAMKGRHYPLTDVGLANLLRRLIEVGDRDATYGECEMQYFTGAKVNSRSCTVIQVMHPVPRRTFRFYLARIFVDDQLNVPTRYESYDWPRTPGGSPELIEEYTFLDLKLDERFSDNDFSTANPEYRFRP